MIMPGTTAPQPEPPDPPPRKPPPPPEGPIGLPTSDEEPRLNIFCAKAQSADMNMSAAIRQSRAVRWARMMRSTMTAVPFVSLGRGNEADDFVLLQLLHDIGEFALRNSGHRDADLVQSAGHRPRRDRQLVGFEEFCDVVRRRLRRKADQGEGAHTRIGGWSRCGLVACFCFLQHDVREQSSLQQNRNCGGARRPCQRPWRQARKELTDAVAEIERDSLPALGFGVDFCEQLFECARGGGSQ